MPCQDTRKCARKQKPREMQSSSSQHRNAIEGAQCNACNGGECDPSVICYCQRNNSMSLGIWSIVFIIIGITQLSSGIIFIGKLPAAQLGTNFSTGIWNIVCSATILVIAFQCPAFQYLCCYSKWPWAGKKAKFTITAKEFVLLNLSGKIRFKWLLAISISVLIINVVNLIVLEVGEWRMAVANEEARFLGKKGLADTMFTAYVMTTVSTSTGVVAGFLYTQFIYCISNRRISQSDSRSYVRAGTMQESIATIYGKSDDSEVQDETRPKHKSDCSQNWVYSGSEDCLLTKADRITELCTRDQNIGDIYNKTATVSRTQSFKVQPVTTPSVATVKRSKTFYEPMAERQRDFEESSNSLSKLCSMTGGVETKIIESDLKRIASLEDLTKSGPNNRMIKLSTKFGEGYDLKENQSASSTSSELSFDKRYPYAKSIELINHQLNDDSDADIDTVNETTDFDSCDDVIDVKDKKSMYNIKQRLIQKAKVSPHLDYKNLKQKAMASSINTLSTQSPNDKIQNKLISEQIDTNSPGITKKNECDEGKKSLNLDRKTKQCERKSSATQTDMPTTLKTRPRVAAAIRKVVTEEEMPEKPQRPPPLPPVEDPVKSKNEQLRTYQSQSSSGYSSPQDSYERVTVDPGEKTVCHVQDGKNITVIRIESVMDAGRNSTSLKIGSSSKKKMEKPVRRSLKEYQKEDINRVEPTVLIEPDKRSKSRLSMTVDGDPSFNSKVRPVGRSVSFGSESRTEWMPLSATLLRDAQSNNINKQNTPRQTTRKSNIKRSSSSVTLGNTYGPGIPPYFPYPNLNLFRLQSASTQPRRQIWNARENRKQREEYERFKHGNYVISDNEEIINENTTELETIGETSLEGSEESHYELHQDHENEECETSKTTERILSQKADYIKSQNIYPNSSQNLGDSRYLKEDGMNINALFDDGNLPYLPHLGSVVTEAMNPNEAFAYFAELELMARHLRNQLLCQQAQMAKISAYQEQNAFPYPKTQKAREKEESPC
ncbi:uncharacterized protein LOC136040824 isoform X2 [Artemia franciscana]|uniref:uncharacterized protein LOC136040824 isoform X2 n=1 Tax=Artemia franciscana TaxID=6661 RepID=UPI0032DB97C1